MCFYLQILSESYKILKNKFELHIIINAHRYSCKVPVILVRFQWDLNFLDIFSKNIQIPIFKKIRPMGAELFYKDGRKDRYDEAGSRFRNFATAHKNERSWN